MKEQIEPPALASSASTLWAVLRKNAILKRRAWKTSICEVVSPAIFLSVLVLGYLLSSVTYIDAGIYAATTLQLTPLIDAIQPLVDGGASAAAAASACENVTSVSVRDMMSQQSGNMSDGLACSPLSSDLDLLRLRESIDSLLNGPLPVLPIDVYLGVGLAVRDSLGPMNYRLLNEFDRYLQLFGNILTPGTLHLCPDTPHVRAFLNYSYARHPTMRNITVRVHATEAVALQAVLNPPNGERTWAVLAFDNLTATHVDYAIRLNYSTVPNTNRITNWIARGLDSRFQRYTTSGEEATRQPLSLSLTTTLEPDHTPDSIPTPTPDSTPISDHMHLSGSPLRLPNPSVIS